MSNDKHDDKQNTRRHFSPEDKIKNSCASLGVRGNGTFGNQISCYLLS